MNTRILCWRCGVVISNPNSRNVCSMCLNQTIDVFSNIRTTGFIQHCRKCESFLAPPKQWMKCEWGSKELLFILIKSVRGLGKYAIKDANFIYTEPHSSRVEFFTEVLLKEHNYKTRINFKYIIKNTQCITCCKLASDQHWTSVIQLRQRVNHKNTFLALEGMFNKDSIFVDCTDIKEAKSGIDFFFSDKKPALKLLEYFQNRFSSKLKKSEQLQSADRRSNRSKYKFTYSLEISPLCVHDLIILSKKYSQKHNVGRLNLVTSARTHISILDPITGKTAVISNYWADHGEIDVVLSSVFLRCFKVERINSITRVGSSARLLDLDVRVEDQSIHCKYVTKDDFYTGMELYGYNLSNTNINNDLMLEWAIILVRTPKNAVSRYLDTNMDLIDSNSVCRLDKLEIDASKCIN